MGTMEIHASQGGKDSELFAQDLAEAVSKASGVTPRTSGRVIVLDRL